MSGDFHDVLEMIDRQPRAKAWQGTFEDYLKLVAEQPAIANTAHARIWRMIESAGITETEDGPIYKFFEQDLYGMEGVARQIAHYFRAAGEGLDVRQRVLLLLGPPASAKSTTVELLKRGLERFSLTNEGALYGITGCPLHEEPLHLLDADGRRWVHERYGVTVEGDLCPVCHWRLDNEWESIRSVGVERIFISEARRQGVGTFAPGDPKVVSMEDLVGSLDLVKVSQYGSEADPRAFDFRGAFEAASRGVMEYIEMMKADATLLYPLITLAQEHQIKAGRFALFYADEAIISHTNLAEYTRFEADKKNEATHNRTYVVKVPYVLRMSDEVRIYDKLFRSSLRSIHVDPHAFKIAALWAVCTRLTGNPKIPPIAAAKLYNGEESAEHTKREIEDLRSEAWDKHQEGMSGVGPRPVVSALSAAAAGKSDGCLNSVDVLRALKQIPEHLVGEYHKDEYQALLESVGKEYTEEAKKDIQRAFIEEFDSAAQTLLTNYLDNADASLRGGKVRHPVTGEMLQADEKLLRSLEEPIHVTENAAREHRRDVLARVGALSRRNETFRWDSHPKLKEAIEKKLFTDLSGTLKATITTLTPDSDQREKVEGVKRRLVEKQGYCPHCADAVLAFIGAVLAR